LISANGVQRRNTTVSLSFVKLVGAALADALSQRISISWRKERASLNVKPGEPYFQK